MTISVAFIGCGEAAQAFIEGWAGAELPVKVSGFDVDPTRSLSETREIALRNVSIVFSLVTADQAGAALEQALHHLPDNALIFDGNSCAPDTKRATEARVTAQGCRYVDLAIMAPVHPKRHETPLLISGQHCKAAQAALSDLGMQARIVEGGVGQASAIKMIRSIMVKGFEALLMECVLAGRAAGIDETVLTSLDDTLGGLDFGKRAGYSMERMTTHGTRRAAEMREVDKTISQLGLPSTMTQATVEWQQQIGKMGINASGTYAEQADAILALLKP